MATDPPTTLQLESKDHQIMDISTEAAMQFRVISDLISTLGPSPKPIPFDNVDSRILSVVIEWCEHHKKDKIQAGNAQDTTIKIDEWDQNLLMTCENYLPSLITAADYFGIDRLSDIVAQKIANNLNGKDATQVAVDFGIPSNEELAKAEKAAKEAKGN